MWEPDRELSQTNREGRNIRKKGQVWNSLYTDIELVVEVADPPGSASSIWTAGSLYSFKIAPGSAYQIAITLKADSGGPLCASWTSPPSLLSHYSPLALLLLSCTAAVWTPLYRPADILPILADTSHATSYKKPS